MTQSFALISIQRDPEEPVVRFSLPEGTCLWPSRSVSGCYSGTSPKGEIKSNRLGE